MYTFGNSGRSFPLNSAEATVYCNETQELVKTSEQYVRQCLQEYPKRLLQVLIRTVRTQARQLCSKTDSRRMQELFRSADCTNAARNEYQRCINSTVDILSGVKTMDDKQKLPFLCCGDHRMQKCFHDGAIKLPICTEEKIENSLRFLDSIQGNMMSLLCNKYDESSDTCDKLQYPTRSNKVKRNKSIVIPIIRVLDSIKDDALKSE